MKFLIAEKIAKKKTLTVLSNKIQLKKKMKKKIPLSNPDSIKHQVSGGFKYPLETLTKKVPRKTATSSFIHKTQNNPTLSKEEIIKQMGLDPNAEELPINFKELLEGEVYGLKSKRELADVVIKDLEKKIEKIKMGRKGIEQKVLEKREEKETQAQADVIIYEGDQRKQYASHILSTLEVHSIENVEALIVSFFFLENLIFI